MIPAIAPLSNVASPKEKCRMRHRLFLTIALFLSFGLVAFAQTVDDARAKATALMEERMGERYPGISVAVAVDGEILFTGAYGFADVEAGTKLTPETKMRIGSVSKPVTAAGLMLLVEQGKIDLDVPIQTYVPSFPKKKFDFTLRQLAGHTAGIRHYKGAELYNKEHYPTVLEGLVIFQDDPLEFEPGTKYSYSSYGWNLISAAMEQPAGVTFLQFMQDDVFEPLGMNDTIADWTTNDIPSRTKFYLRASKKPREAREVDNSYKWAGGGFLSTPTDLVKFGSAHLKPGFLTQESLDTIFTSQTIADGKLTNYGIGWRIQPPPTDNALLLWQHGGSSVGGKASLMVVPDVGVVAAMLANVTNHPDIERDNAAIASAFADAVMADRLAAAR
jgi:serine beta-lactamase-like protein LACTB, mitochondrial